jgi:hypothetical protein
VRVTCHGIARLLTRIFLSINTVSSTPHNRDSTRIESTVAAFDTTTRTLTTTPQTTLKPSFLTRIRSDHLPSVDAEHAPASTVLSKPGMLVNIVSLLYQKKLPAFDYVLPAASSLPTFPLLRLPHHLFHLQVYSSSALLMNS